MDFFLENPMLVTYMFLKLTSIQMLLAFTSIIAVLATLFFTVICQSELDKWLPKKVYVSVVLLVLLSVAMPSSRDVAIMYGVSTGVAVGKTLADSEVTKKSLSLLEVYVEKELDKAKKELEKSN